MDGLDVILICFSLLGAGLLACSWMQQRHWARKHAVAVDFVHPINGTVNAPLLHRLIEHMAEFDTLDDTEEGQSPPF